MSAELSAFEQALKSHFEDLAAKKLRSDKPIFAIEHCILQSDLGAMRKLLFASLQAGGPKKEFHHCWVVHAAEHGYQFQGLEFWRSFAETTPGWDRHGDRQMLRSWFEQFSKLYRGVRPVGTWGEHYKYIAWPITHALLPSDLQIQLAHTLYNMRYRLDDLIAVKPDEAGKIVARHAILQSTRFQHFLRQYELVGNLVRALLEETPDESIVHTLTLNRITEDINKKHDARGWLNDARRYYQKFQIKFGVSTQRFRLDAAGGQDRDSELKEHGIVLSPRLQLRRKGVDEWDAYLLVPSFHSLVNTRPAFRAHLNRARYLIPMHDETSLFPGASLIAAGRSLPKKLQQWPSAQTPLLKFSVSELEFDRLVNAECQIAPSNLWVFKLLEDGTAPHVQGRSVHPDHSYIVVARRMEDIADLGHTQAIGCSGVFAIRLDIPKKVSSDLTNKLLRFNLAPQTVVRVEPVGLRPRQWSDEGFGEWLSTETPMFALKCDCEFDSYIVRVGGSEINIARNLVEAATIFSVCDLGVGRHELSINALAHTVNKQVLTKKSVASAKLTLYIRHPTTWSPQSQLPAAMLVDTNPAVPCLRDLLDGTLELQVHGDEARYAECQIVHKDPVSGEELLTPVMIPPRRLPISKADWARALDSFLRQEEHFPFLNSSDTSLKISCDDLGESRIPLANEIAPVRWSIRKGNPPCLYLTNDGVTQRILIEHYSFSRPLSPIKLNDDDASLGLPLKARSGLFVAKYEGALITIIAATDTRAHGFQELQAEIDSADLQSVTSLSHLLTQYQIWKSAQAGSSYANFKRRSVMRHILQHMHRGICGSKWMQLQAFVEDNPSRVACWQNLEAAVQKAHPPSFAISLSKAWLALVGWDLTAIEQRYREITKSFFQDTNHDELALAWQLATNPADVTEPSKIILDQSLRSERFATLFRGARLLVLSNELNRAGAQS